MAASVLEPAPQRGAFSRARAAAATAGAAVLGAAPHVLHHAGPLAGAALFAGIGGRLLFGALGLLLAVPMLVRLRRRSGSWRLPGGLLALMALVFTASTLWLGPALAGDDEPDRDGAAPIEKKEAEHDAHHP